MKNEGSTRNWSYAYTLPPDVSDALTEEVEDFAAEDPKHLHAEPWSHEMPVWLIVQQRGARANLTRVEAIWQLEVLQPVLAFVPDAFEDNVEIKGDGLKTTVRRVPASSDISSQVQLLSLFEAKDREGLRKKIRGLLEFGLKKASELELKEERTLAYPAPAW